MRELRITDKLRVEWRVRRTGGGGQTVDFTGADFAMFLVDSKGLRFPLVAERKKYDLLSGVAEKLPHKGVYDLLLTWVQQVRLCGNGVRAQQRAVAKNVFSVGEADGEDARTAVLKLNTTAVELGYDGLDVYELHVLRGKTDLSEEEWLEQTGGAGGTVVAPIEDEFIESL